MTKLTMSTNPPPPPPNIGQCGAGRVFPIIAGMRVLGSPPGSAPEEGMHSCRYRNCSMSS